MKSFTATKSEWSVYSVRCLFFRSNSGTDLINDKSDIDEICLYIKVIVKYKC